LFSACVEPERSESVKTCSVRACLTLIQEVCTLDTGLKYSNKRNPRLLASVGSGLWINWKQYLLLGSGAYIR
jgi:hypothetical protein